MYEATHYSSTCFTISGSGDITDEFHPGRQIEYATITGSTTISGISTPTVTNSGVTGSGTLISGSLTQNYYDYLYGIVKSSSYIDPFIYVTVTPESDTVISGSTIYVKYGAGQSGLDDTFPSTSDSGTIYKLKRLEEYVGDNITSGIIKSTNYESSATGFGIDLDNEDIIVKPGGDILLQSVSGTEDINRSFVTWEVISGTINLAGNHQDNRLSMFPADGAEAVSYFDIGSDYNEESGRFKQVQIFAKDDFSGGVYNTTSGSEGSHWAESYSRRGNIGDGEFAITGIYSEIDITTLYYSELFVTTGHDDVGDYDYSSIWFDSYWVCPNFIGVNLGSSTYYYSYVYSDNFVNVADFYFMDSRKDEDGNLVAINDVEVIKNIKPTNNFDPVSGLQIIDDNTLPNWLLLKNKEDVKIPATKSKRTGKTIPAKTHMKGETAYTDDGKPYLEIKTMISLLMGAIKQLDERIVNIEEKLKEK